MTSKSAVGVVRGVVVWFNSAKGFGFLKPDNGGADVFVHYSALCMEGYKKLDEGDVVEFEVEDGKDGRKQAANVVKVEA
jgi:CspA family cold shock protein